MLIPKPIRGGLWLQTPAKLNLFFEIVGKRSDGYHEVETILHAVDFFDDLTAAPHESLLLTCSNPDVPTDDRNTILKAARLLRDATGITRGARFHLFKRIPPEMGLGGGSGNAAGALVLLNELWNTGLSFSELREIAAGVGADVPFFLGTPTALGRGRGDLLEPLEMRLPLHFVLHLPRFRMSTAEVFRSLGPTLTSPRRPVNLLLNFLASSSIENAAELLFNRLEEAVCLNSPEYREMFNEFSHPEFLTRRMTGSGAALFGLCRDELAARRALTDLRASGWNNLYLLQSLDQ
jgi:4-diphosphocytidyl-2-C-methyl-D-erythritol kinase